MRGALAVFVRCLVLLIAAVLLLGVGLVSVAHLRPQWLGMPLERVLSQVLERRVEIGSIERLDLGRDVVVRLTELRIANRPWADEPWLLVVHRLGFAVALPSLWGAGPVVIHQLDADGFEANLLAPDGHPPNWEFESDLLEAEAPWSPSDGPPLIVHEGQLRDGVLHYRDPDQDLRLELAGLDIVDPGGGQLISLQANGAMNGAPLYGNGRVGPASSLLTGRDLAVDVQLGWGDLQLELAGTLANLSTLERPDLRFTVSAPRARPLLDALGMTEVRDGTLRVEGRLATGARGVTLDVAGALGDFLVELDGYAGKPLQLDEVELQWHLTGPSLQEAGAVAELTTLPALPYEISGELARAGSLLELRRGRLLVGTAEVDFEGRLPEFPEVAGGELDLVGRRLDPRLLEPLLGPGRMPGEPFELHGSLRPGEPGAAVVAVEMASPATRLVLDGVLRSGPAWRGSRVRIVLSGGDLSASLGTFAGVPLPSDPFEVAGTLSSAADGFHLSEGHLRAGTLAAGLDGSLEALAADANLQADFNVSTPDLAGTLQTWGLSAGVLERFPVSLNGRLAGSLDRLRLVSSSLEAGASQGHAEGLLGNPADPADLELDVAVSGPDLLSLLVLPGASGSAALPFTLAGSMARKPPGWSLHGVTGRLGAAELDLDATLVDAEGFPGSRVALSLAGQSLAASLGPLVTQTLPDEPFSVVVDLVYRPEQITVPRLEASLGDLALSGELDLSNPAELGDTRGGLALRGPSARALLGLLGVDLDLPDGPVSADVVLRGNRERLSVSEVDVVLADSDLSGAGEWHFGGEGRLPEINLDLRSRTLYLPFLFPQPAGAAASTGAVGSESAAAWLSGREGAGDGEAGPLAVVDEERSRNGAGGEQRVIPDVPLHFSWLNLVNGRMRYRIDDLVVREGSKDRSDASEVDLSIRDGVLTTQRLVWSGTVSTGAAELRLAALDHGGDIEFYMHSRRIPLLWLLAGEPEPGTKRSYRAYLSSHGATVREMAGNLRGALAYEGGGGRISNDGLVLLFGDLLNELALRINPFYRQEPYTRVSCSAGAVRIDGGVIEIDPGVVFRTDKVDVAAGGSIDLRDERLSVTFRSQARRGIGISAAKAVAPYVKLGGTLAEPRLVLDPRGAAVAGGTAVATAGLSIIAGGLWDRWIATSANPCERLFTQISEQERAEYAALLSRPDISPPVDDDGP